MTEEDAGDRMEADNPLCQMKEEDFCYHLIFFYLDLTGFFPVIQPQEL